MYGENTHLFIVVPFGESAHMHVRKSYTIAFVCLSFCLSVCLSACMSICMSVCMSVCTPVCLSVCMSVCMSAIYPSVHVHVTSTFVNCTVHLPLTEHAPKIYEEHGNGGGVTHVHGSATSHHLHTAPAHSTFTGHIHSNTHTQGVYRSGTNWAGVKAITKQC